MIAAPLGDILTVGGLGSLVVALLWLGSLHRQTTHHGDAIKGLSREMGEKVGVEELKLVSNRIDALHRDIREVRDWVHERPSRRRGDET